VCVLQRLRHIFPLYAVRVYTMADWYSDAELKYSALPAYNPAHDLCSLMKQVRL
jgi:hypothetical protein